jgi:hypothetical protein
MKMARKWHENDMKMARKWHGRGGVTPCYANQPTASPL